MSGAAVAGRADPPLRPGLGCRSRAVGGRRTARTTSGVIMVFGDKKDKEGREARSDAKDDEGGFLPEIVRRAVERSVNAVLQGDDERRKLMGALFPKEIVHTAVQSALQAVDGTKREALELVGREMQQFLATLNLSEEIRKVLTSVSFEIKTEVRFVANEDGTLRTVVKGSPRIKPTAAKAKPRAKAGRRKAAAKPAAQAKPVVAPASAVPAAVTTLPGALIDGVSDAVAGTRRGMRRVADRIAETAVDLAEMAVRDADE